MAGKKEGQVLLSFDTEEFDVPREHGVDISLDEGVRVSAKGTNLILDILKQCHASATFFCTVNFAERAPEVMERILNEGHEVASHGVDHWTQQPSDLARSKEILEQITGRKVNGYRQPRMYPVDDKEIERAGYLYNSSLHPTVIPGRYMNLDIPRTPFYTGTTLQIPASVSTWLRLPVFWLACHHYPQWLYRWLCRRILRHDGLLVVYFHPWEFIALGKHPEWHIPAIIRHHCGNEMAQRLTKLIQMLKNQGAQFITYSEFTEQFAREHKQQP